MTKIITYFLIFIGLNNLTIIPSIAQFSDTFRYSGKTFSPIGVIYTEGVLSLDTDSVFLFQNSAYRERKRDKNRLAFDTEIAKGRYLLDGDTLKLTTEMPDSIKGRVYKFLMYKNNLYFLPGYKNMPFSQSRKYAWRRMRNI